MKPIQELNVDQRHLVAEWIETTTTAATCPEPVRIFLGFHKRYLEAAGDPTKAFNAAQRELRRALHITPSSEKRSSGSPLSNLPKPAKLTVEDERRRLEQEVEQGEKLSNWHRKLQNRHKDRTKRAKEKLAKMDRTQNPKPEAPIALEDIPLTPQQEAEAEQNAKRFVRDLQLGGKKDPTLASAMETLMKVAMPRSKHDKRRSALKFPKSWQRPPS